MTTTNYAKLLPAVQKQATICGLTDVIIVSGTVDPYNRKTLNCTGVRKHSNLTEKFTVFLTATGKVKANSFRWEYVNEFIRDNND